MKKLVVLMFAFVVGITQAQNTIEPKFEKEGELVKATYYHENGSIRQQGFFKDKKLTGMWTQFDEKGNKVALGFYKNGKKDGKWFYWNKTSLKEITYKKNTIANVNVWKEDSRSRIASNK